MDDTSFIASRKAARAQTVLDDPSKAWIVRGTGADLYLAEAEGPRRHLLRVPDGALITGVGRFPADHFSVIALTIGKSVLEPLSTGIPLPADLIDAWIESLSQSFRASPPPRTVPLLQDVVSEVDLRAVAPRTGVLWAAPHTGEAFLFGDRSLIPALPAQPLPVSSASWLEPAESTNFTARSTSSLQESGQFAAAFSRFLNCVRQRWQAAAEQQERTYRERAEHSRHADSDRMGEALHHLAAPLRKNTPLFTSDSHTPGAAWLQCLRTIGAVEHITFHFPEGALHNDQHPEAQIAALSGVRFRPVLLRDTWWKQDHGSLLTRLSATGDPVALLASPRGYHLYDPHIGRRRLVNASIAAGLDPQATLFYRPFPSGPLTGGVLLRFAFRDRAPDVRRLLAFSLAAALVTLSLPIVIGEVFNRIIPQAEHSQLALVATLLLVLAVVTTLFNYARGLVVLRIEGLVDSRVQAAVWDRLLQLPPSFLRGYSTGDLANRSLGIQTIREALSGAVAESLLSGVFSLITFALLLSYSVSLGLTAAALTLCAVSVSLALGFLQIKHQRTTAETTGKLSSITLGLIQGIAKIRVAAAEPRAFLTWSERYRVKVESELQGRRVRNILAAFAASWSPLSLALLFTVYLVGIKSTTLAAAATPSAPPPVLMSTGDFLAFLAAFAIMLRAVLSLADAAMKLAAAAPAYTRALPLLQTSPEAGPERSPAGTLHGAIALRSVTFRYNEGLPAVIRNLSLSIAPGEFIAVVGSSGSGKSTLLRLLLGFEDPTTGSVLFDGRDLRTLEVRGVRRQIGTVLQNGRIGTGSVFYNIVGGSSSTVEDAWEAARSAGFAADIEAMPMGMHTVLSEGGTTLSGGQRQRLLIARALVRHPRIIFFDEATSALDNHTQAIVSRSLDNLQATRVVIAHRLSTIERADRIYVMDKGELVEQGTMPELLARNGVFAELARRQML